jgi:threonine dehydrogenase-like Zn-dependent dehydrogenase
MTMEANAVVFTAPNTVEFRRVECPEPGPNDAVIRLTHSWLSNGTEGSYLRGERVRGDTPYRPGDRYPFPNVAGYQRVGIVERVGRDIKDLSVGEVVFSVVGKVQGMFHAVGGQVSPSVSERQWIWKLPKTPEPLAFAGMVLTQVGYNCGTRAPIAPGDWAIVIGDGLVGQWAAQTLIWRGASVLLVGRREMRLSLAEKLTGCRVINQKTTDWLDAAAKITGDQLAVAVDTVGSPQATQDVISAAATSSRRVSSSARIEFRCRPFGIKRPRSTRSPAMSTTGWTERWS